MQSSMFRRYPGVLRELTENFLDKSLAAGNISRSSRETTSLSLRISGIEEFAVVEGVDSEPEEGSLSLLRGSAVLTNGC